MGELVMAASNDEDKMGETVAASDRSLEMSVSFGRFENDSLSWEKWSSFSPNKYMEEVEKCATPGSVAMKKAYFEAHYKKIAARKAEQLGQEKQMDRESLGSNDQSSGDAVGKPRGTDSELDVSDAQTFDEGTRHETQLHGELDPAHVEEHNENPAADLDGQGLSVERGEVELGTKLDAPRINKLEEEEAPLVKERATLSMEFQEMKELPKNSEKETESIPAAKRENAKLDLRKKSEKISPMTKIRDMPRIKKKPASPVAISPQISAQKVTKTVPVSSISSTPLSLTKKATDSSLPKSKSPSVRGNKKVSPKSLHMSLSMDTSNSDPSPVAPAHSTTVRTSFIMEKMKDKEIVKRAFKTFQNNFNQLRSSAEEKSLAAKQVPIKGTEVNVSSSVTPRKENAGSFKAVTMDKKTAKAAPSSFVSKSDERAEKKKEFSKKLEEKSNAKEAERTSQTRSKEEKASEIRKQRQSLNFKAVPMPGFYRGQKLSKTPLDKEGSKSLRI